MFVGTLGWCSCSHQQSLAVVMGPGSKAGTTVDLLHLREPIIQRIAGAAHGADRVLLAAGIEQFAQAADMHIDGALVDIDVAAPDAVEQLLAAEHPPRMLKEELQQAVLGRAEIDRPARAGDTP